MAAVLVSYGALSGAVLPQYYGRVALLLLLAASGCGWVVSMIWFRRFGFGFLFAALALFVLVLGVADVAPRLAMRETERVMGQAVAEIGRIVSVDGADRPLELMRSQVREVLAGVDRRGDVGRFELDVDSGGGWCLVAKYRVTLASPFVSVRIFYVGAVSDPIRGRVARRDVRSGQWVLVRSG